MREELLKETLKIILISLMRIFTLHVDKLLLSTSTVSLSILEILLYNLFTSDANFLLNHLMYFMKSVKKKDMTFFREHLIFLWEKSLLKIVVKKQLSCQSIAKKMPQVGMLGFNSIFSKFINTHITHHGHSVSEFKSTSNKVHIVNFLNHLWGCS